MEAASEQLLTSLEQKASPEHAALLVVDIQNDFVADAYSGVINTGLDALLKQHGIKSLLLTGVATDTCVEATARDAYFIDYYVTLVADCCGAASEQDHLGALKRFERDYGPVVTSSDVMGVWQQSGLLAARLAAEHVDA